MNFYGWFGKNLKIFNKNRDIFYVFKCLISIFKVWIH